MGGCSGIRAGDGKRMRRRLRRRRKISAPYPSWPGLSRPSTSLRRWATNTSGYLSRLRQSPRQTFAISYEVTAFITYYNSRAQKSYLIRYEELMADDSTFRHLCE